MSAVIRDFLPEAILHTATYLADDGVIASGGVVPDPVQDLKRLLQTGVDSVKGFVIALHGTSRFASY